MFFRTLLIAGALPLAAFSADPFDSDIAPILRQYCLPCHDSKTRTSAYSVDSKAQVIAGGARYGAAVKHGNPASSPLVKILKGELKPQMPFGKQLPADIITKIEKWVA